MELSGLPTKLSSLLYVYVLCIFPKIFVYVYLHTYYILNKHENHLQIIINKISFVELGMTCSDMVRTCTILI